MSTRSAHSSLESPPPTQLARVAIAEDSLLVREGLHRILRDAGFDIVAEVATREQLLEAVELLCTDGDRKRLDLGKLDGVEFIVYMIDCLLRPRVTEHRVLAAAVQGTRGQRN